MKTRRPSSPASTHNHNLTPNPSSPITDLNPEISGNVSGFPKNIVAPQRLTTIGICISGLRLAIFSGMPPARLLALCLVPFLLGGCRAVKPLTPDDLSAPGWNLRQGQAVWKTQESELAGEVILATRNDGSSSLQFIKTPLPLVSAQRRAGRWTARFYADNQTISGRGTPPIQLLWLHLASVLRGTSPPKPLVFSAASGGNWELRNGETGESISGFLNP